MSAQRMGEYRAAQHGSILEWIIIVLLAAEALPMAMQAFRGSSVVSESFVEGICRAFSPRFFGWPSTWAYGPGWYISGLRPLAGWSVVR